MASWPRLVACTYLAVTSRLASKRSVMALAVHMRPNAFFKVSSGILVFTLVALSEKSSILNVKNSFKSRQFAPVTGINRRLYTIGFQHGAQVARDTLFL